MKEFSEQAFKCICGGNVNLFRSCGIISKYTEASNSAAKPNSLRLFLHSCN